MPLLFESRRMNTVPMKIDEELKAHAVGVVTEHRGEIQNLTAASFAMAKQRGVSRESVQQSPPLSRALSYPRTSV